MEAGVNGVLIQKLEQLGVLPPECLQAVVQVSQMDDKEYNAVLQQAKEQQADAMKGGM